MNIAIYWCENHDAMTELLGHLDPHESMHVITLGNAYGVVYQSPNLAAVATDPDITGVKLMNQCHLPNG